MSTTFRFQILSPEGKQLDVQTESVQLPGTDGSLGVMAGHAPLIAALSAGTVRYRADGRWQETDIPGGTAAVTGGELLILTEMQ